MVVDNAVSVRDCRLAPAGSERADQGQNRARWSVVRHGVPARAFLAGIESAQGASGLGIAGWGLVGTTPDQSDAQGVDSPVDNWTDRCRGFGKARRLRRGQG